MEVEVEGMGGRVECRHERVVEVVEEVEVEGGVEGVVQAVEVVGVHRERWEGRCGGPREAHVEGGVVRRLGRAPRVHG